jgi:hypothetical protein
MAGERGELIAEGDRGGIAIWEGKVCRDRLPWGGFTEPDRCDCVGSCRYDADVREEPETSTNPGLIC